jgi:hypothetical protein
VLVTKVRFDDITLAAQPFFERGVGFLEGHGHLAPGRMNWIGTKDGASYAVK